MRHRRCPTYTQLKQVVLEHPAARWPDFPQLRHVCNLALVFYYYLVGTYLYNDGMGVFTSILACRMPFSHPGCVCQCPLLHPRTRPYWISLVMTAASAISWSANKMFTNVVDPSAAVVVMSRSFIFSVAPNTLSLARLVAQVTTHLASLKCCTHFTSWSLMTSLIMPNKRPGSVLSDM